jgi:hypothetical protein
MKTITLLVTAIVLGLSAHATEQFVPSHAVAAKLRFEALRAGEDASEFDYTRAQAPLTDDTRAELHAAEEARRKARVAKLLGEYEAQYEQHVADNERTEDELINLIKALQAKVDAAAQANKQAATESLTDSTLAKAGIGVGGLLAGLAASGFIFRTRKSLS